MAQSAFFTGPLYERMPEDLHLTGKAKRTHDGCHPYSNSKNTSLASSRCCFFHCAVVGAGGDGMALAFKVDGVELAR